MKTEILFVAFCAGFCAAMIWAALRLNEPFYVAVAAFAAAFFGSLAALAVWGRISAGEESEGRSDFATYRNFDGTWRRI